MVIFRPNQRGDLHELILALQQDGIVLEYWKKFELLYGPLTGVFQSILEGDFLKGIKPEICAELRLLRPREFGECMELAHRVDEGFGMTIPE